MGHLSLNICFLIAKTEIKLTWWKRNNRWNGREHYCIPIRSRWFRPFFLFHYYCSFFFLCYNPFLWTYGNDQSLQVAVFIFCNLLQESNLISSAAVCVVSGFVMSIWIWNEYLILFCACVHICTYTHWYMYNIYTIYTEIYIGSVYTFIHNIVYIVSTGDKLNWIQTLVRLPFPCSHCTF